MQTRLDFTPHTNTFEYYFFFVGLPCLRLPNRGEGEAGHFLLSQIRNLE